MDGIARVLDTTYLRFFSAQSRLESQLLHHASARQNNQFNALCRRDRTVFFWLQIVILASRHAPTPALPCFLERIPRKANAWARGSAAPASGTLCCGEQRDDNPPGFSSSPSLFRNFVCWFGLSRLQYIPTLVVEASSSGDNISIRLLRGLPQTSSSTGTRHSVLPPAATTPTNTPAAFCRPPRVPSQTCIPAPTTPPLL